MNAAADNAKLRDLLEDAVKALKQAAVVIVHAGTTYGALPEGGDDVLSEIACVIDDCQQLTKAEPAATLPLDPQSNDALPGDTRHTP